MMKCTEEDDYVRLEEEEGWDCTEEVTILISLKVLRIHSSMYVLLYDIKYFIYLILYLYNIII